MKLTPDERQFYMTRFATRFNNKATEIINAMYNLLNLLSDDVLFRYYTSLKWDRYGK